ncbi:GAF domain-containing protein [Actinomadura alba]|uniref:GAF domain-containing protein n=1 Tax=Actinomadura alba TaxID=406431 RepID=A0ABR7LYD6_9ACTN|nr:GAF domain-containing protein [Actinomadura alba]MBC6469877.1 GAF domain-containing protein [Actinomadura alba]
MTADGIASLTLRPEPPHQTRRNAAAEVAFGRPSESRVAGHADRIAGTFQLMTALLEGAELAELLTLVADRARHMSGARLVFMALPGETPNTLTIDFANGVNADQVRGVIVRVGTSAIGRAFISRRALSMRVASDPALKGLPPGPILLLPLDTGERTCGVLALAGRPGDMPFSPPVKRQLLIFATTSATLIELAEEHRASRRD